jgi:xylulokinase
VLIGLDVGTSAARAVAVDITGHVVAGASESYPLSTPRPGWTEQDPDDWWRASQAVLKKVAASIPEPPAGIGLTGQMHGSVFLDAHDAVIRPALLWSDQRTADQCREINHRVGADRLVEITGNPAITGFQAPKILWLHDHEPAAYARVSHVLLPKDYVRMRLTGEFATDASDASGTLLLDLRRRAWSDEILAALAIPGEWLPTVHEGPDRTGAVIGPAAAATGLPAGLPVAAGGGDNAASAVGNGIVREGLVSSSIGTSGVVFAHVDAPKVDPQGRLHAFCHAVPGAYHLMGVTLAAGGALSWWRDVLGGDLDYEALESLARQAPVGSEGLIFLPYLSGERTPHLDPDLRGAFAGLTLRHTRAHLTRAVMEGVTFSLKDCLDLMTGLGLAIGEVRVTGGGARSPLWRQMLADVFGLPIRRTRVDEGPAFGAALLAGVAAGAYRSVDEACTLVQPRPETEKPDTGHTAAYARYHAAYKELYASMSRVIHRLSELSR